MRFLYSVAIGIAVWMVLVPMEVAGILAGRGSWSDLAERLGRTWETRRDGAHRIVVHAVSVGEMAAARALLPALARQLNGVQFVLTAGNRAGRLAARRLAAERTDVVAVRLLPWDRSRALTRWLAGSRPDLFVVVETEIWPNLYHVCGQRGIPLCIVNGRIYPADAGRYGLAPRFFGRVLDNVRWIGVQSEQDARRFRDLGIPAARMEVIGNLKYDAPAPDAVIAPVAASSPLLLAASTHAPEEDLVLEALGRLRQGSPDLRCVIAPRHPARARAVCGAALARGWQPVLWSQRPFPDDHLPLVIVDEMGALADLFSRADVVIMGGSFAPRGGHNILEPAAAGRAMVVGPHMEHFAAIVDDFVRRGAICQLTSGTDLVPEVARLLADEEARLALGRRAREAFLSGGGVAPVCAGRLARILDSTVKSVA